jgi:hypothetical protein
MVVMCPLQFQKGHPTVVSHPGGGGGWGVGGGTVTQKDDVTRGRAEMNIITICKCTVSN